MNKNITKVFCAICFLFVSVMSFAQQNSEACCQSQAPNTETAGFEDPLIPQSFAVDTKTQTIAVIDTPENTIVILKRTADGFKTIKSIVVDVVKQRHDVQFIFKPKSVAIYDNNVVFLASNRDSSYIKVVDMNGENVYTSRKFSGAASAFSYDKATKHIYVAGLNTSGYNIFDIDCTDGFKNINIDTVSTPKAAYITYKIPKKSEDIAKHDPYGLGLTMIAMGTVFFALVFISLVLIAFAKALKKLQTKRVRKDNPAATKAEAKEEVKKHGEIAGDAFAAIAAAIYMYNEELHDEENTILTITKVSRMYSPWSSKIHNMNVYRRK